jgi:KipI family sensor histidine kinase inhibitor
MIYDAPRFSLLAGEILSVEVGDEISLSCSARVHALFASLSKIEGITEVTPAYASLAARVDVRSTTAASAIRAVKKAWAKSAPEETKGKLVKVPVCYEEAFAPDLGWMSEKAGLRRDEAIALHSSKVYTCMMLGFAPGFVYLDEVDPKIRSDRMDTPRTKVQAGSVGIAGAQTGIYGIETPGGWRLIGRTPLTMFNPRSSPPTPIGPGDHVRFEPITAQEFKFIKSASPAHPILPEGVPVLEVEQPGIFSTIQDQGRPDYRHLGVPNSGGIDHLSQVQANYILGNPAGRPAIEILGGFFKVRALTDVVLAVTGADCELTVNRAKAEIYAALLLREGEELSIGKTTKGFVNYLAVAGTFSAESAMGSSSTYAKGSFGGYQGRALKTGDMIGVTDLSDHVMMRSVFPNDRTDLSGEKPVRATKGLPQEGDSAAKAFFRSGYTVSEVSDRTGFRLKVGDRLPQSKAQLLTCPTFPGYVQVPPDGLPIVLQQDCPTTGGYQVVAAVLPSEMGRFSQLRPGSKVGFEEVDEARATKDAIAFAKRLAAYSGGMVGL